MVSIQPELWVDAGSSAIEFYARAFGAVTLHVIGDDDDLVAQLAVGDAVFWIATAKGSSERFVPRSLGGATARLLLVVDDPTAVQNAAVFAGASERSPVDHEHGWLVGRVIDPYGHEWEIGRPMTTWPPPPSA